MVGSEFDVAVDVAVGEVGEARLGGGVGFSANDTVEGGLDFAVVGLLDTEVKAVIARLDVDFRAPAEETGTAKGDVLFGAVDTVDVDAELFDEIGIAILDTDEFADVSIDELFGIFGEDTGRAGERLIDEAGGAGLAAGGEFVLLAGGGLGFAESSNVAAKLASVWEIAEIGAAVRLHDGDLVGSMGFGISPGAAGFFGHDLDTARTEEIKLINFVLEIFDVVLQKVACTLQGVHEGNEVGMTEIFELLGREHGRELGDGAKIR